MADTPPACPLDADGVLLHTHKDIVILLVAFVASTAACGLFGGAESLSYPGSLRASFPDRQISPQNGHAWLTSNSALAPVRGSKSGSRAFLFNQLL